MSPLIILGIAGSLRAASINKRVLRAAQALVPDGVRLDAFDLEGIPLFNQDLEKDPPPRVRELKQAIRESAAVLFVTPEYNYGIPGVLKNAIDWASRPSGDNAWLGKPAGIMGATGGMWGTVRAQIQLRQVFLFLKVIPLGAPEVLIAQYDKKFDADGNVTDETTKKVMTDLLKRLADLARQTAQPAGGSAK